MQRCDETCSTHGCNDSHGCAAHRKCTSWNREIQTPLRTPNGEVKALRHALFRALSAFAERITLTYVRAANAALVAFLTVAIFWLSGVLGPSLEDHRGESAAARQAIRELAQQERFAKAAQAMCGPNAAYEDLGNGEVQCFTHRGKKTIRATL